MILKIGHLFCQLIKSQQNQMKIYTFLGNICTFAPSEGHTTNKF